jgi:pimeloyl-ACP methyl ester carboxylesterase
LFLVLAVAGVLALPAQARAAIPLTSCGRTPGLECGEVVVPVDRTGRTPGTIALHVEVLPPRGTSRGVIFLLAGGPGQGSAEAYALGTADGAEFARFLFPDYTLVAFDNRGTGKSGLIECPALQKTITTSVEQAAGLTRDCAEQIGPTRQFYATRDHAEDIESVRTALGFGPIALYGVSYGTKLALAYALAHPDEVTRMVLDSVVPPELPDPYERNVVQAMPRTLQELCAGSRCRGITSNLANDAAVLANRLEAKPAVGKILAPGGHAITKHMNGEDLLGVIIDSDLNPGIQAALPAAIHAARGGYTRPLLRLFDLDQRTSDLSFGLFVATTCADVHFPWTPDTPPSGRPGVLSAAVGSMSAGAFGPFGSWAARIGPAYDCELWPSPAGNTPLAPGPLPNVPVLTFSGGLDFRTPTSSAQAVTNLFPQGHLVVVPGTGHNVLNPFLQSSCPFQALRNWLGGLAVPTACPRVPFFQNPIRSVPRTSARKAPATTAVDVARSLRDAEAAWLETVFSAVNLSPPGLYGGRVTTTAKGFRLRNYSSVPGVRLSGNVNLVAGRVPLVITGSVRVAGAGAAAGSLRIARGRVSGTLAGRRVSASL